MQGKIEKLEHNGNNTAKKILVEYEDGRIEELGKGMAIKLGKTDETGQVQVSLNMVEMTPQDLAFVVTSMLQLGMEMGMFDDPVFGDEEDADDE